MQMQSTYWLEKVLKMISLYVSALLCNSAVSILRILRIDTAELHRVYNNSVATVRLACTQTWLLLQLPRKLR
jgi:hypothetical protein